MKHGEPGFLCCPLAHAHRNECERAKGSDGVASVRLFALMAFAGMMATSEGADANAARASKTLKPHPDAKANIHAPGEVDRPELVPYIVTDPASLPGIVMDETEAKLEGTWQYSTHTPPYVGLGYLHDLRDGKGAKSATFTPTIPR